MVKKHLRSVAELVSCVHSEPRLQEVGRTSE